VLTQVACLKRSIGKVIVVITVRGKHMAHKIDLRTFADSQAQTVKTSGGSPASVILMLFKGLPKFVQRRQ
jgi:hypothetical protein